MKIEPAAVTLGDGRSCTLRSPGPADAKELLAVLRQAAGETDFLLREPWEINYTPGQERNYINGVNNAADQLMILAVVDGAIVGNAGFWPVGAFRRIRHRCEIGVMVQQAFWGRGIATALLTRLLERAAAVGYEQAELTVVSGNARAVSLYERLGFRAVGVIPNGMKYSDGAYADDTVMVRSL